MGEFIGHERLFRAADGAFLLHMSSGGKLEAEERIIWLTVRDAISWLNDAPDHFGFFLGVRGGRARCSANTLRLIIRMNTNARVS